MYDEGGFDDVGFCFVVFGGYGDVEYVVFGYCCVEFFGKVCVVIVFILVIVVECVVCLDDGVL